MQSSENPSRAGEATVLLNAIESGDKQAAADLLPLVYDELRRLARGQIARQRPGYTLQPTALVHEAFLKLVGPHDPGWNSKGHFFGAAARAMREILVDRARSRSRLKRGGDRDREALHDDALADTEFQQPFDDMLRLDEALRRLESEHPQRTEIVMLRCFAGLTNDQIASSMGVSSRTIERGWRFARAWLHKELGGDLREPSVVNGSDPP